MSDTSTTLNIGTGGDVMDESLVTTSAGTVKRTRVAIGGDASGAALVDPVKADPGASPYSLPALGVAVVDEAPPGGFVSGELRPLSVTTEGRLRVSFVAASVTFDFFGDDSPSFVGTPAFSGSNPWF